MKKYLRPNYLPWISLGSGIVGLALRIWMYTDGVDAKGLLLQSHPANALSFLICAVFFIFLTLCVSALGHAPKHSQLFSGKPSVLLGNGIAAAAIILTGFSGLNALNGLFSPLYLLVELLSAASLLYIGWCSYKKQRISFLFHASVTACLMLRLITQYKVWSSEPQLQNYFFHLAASIFLMLTAYHRTALDARSGNRSAYVFFNQAAVFFCILSLAGTDWLYYGAMGIWALTNLCSLRSVQKRILQTDPKTMHLPAPVRYCIDTLEQSGFRAYAVGGCVRDNLLGIVPNDYDLCTNATPEQICSVFSQYPLVHNGEKHGTVGVILDSGLYEITTFRTEGSYSDGRHPDSVEFVNTVEEDLSRRDFTVNAIAYSPKDGYIDPQGGKKDLSRNILRAVGEPRARFQEDALRILRGARFSVRYNLTPERETDQAMAELAPLLDGLAKERVFDELCKLLPLVKTGDLLHYAPILTQVLPELAPAIGFRQHSPYHAYDVYTHTAHVTAAVPPTLTLRWAALLHDIGKAETFSQDETGRGHFHGHASIGAATADSILLRLKAPTSLRQRVVFLIEHHMTPLGPDRKILLRRLSAWGEEALRELLALQKADAVSKGIPQDVSDFSATEQLLEQLLQEKTCLSVKDLMISGKELLTLGHQPGPKIGECLTHLLQLVQDEQISNTPEALTEAAKQYFSQEETQ